jgi:hypothetical protein
MSGESAIVGPGYSVQLPPGFTVAVSIPLAGVYRLLPPGVTPFDIQAGIQIRPVDAVSLPVLLQNLYAMENPMVGFANAANLGLANVLGMLPVRQVQMPQGLTHIREFDGVTMLGFPVRVMVLVIQGAQSSVEVVVMVNLYRWMEFIGPCLDFVGRINLGGIPQAPPKLQALVDKNRKDQIEYQLVPPNQQPIPLTALPTSVGGTTIIHVDTLIQTGNINGTGIAVGTQSTASVRTENASRP